MEVLLLELVLAPSLIVVGTLAQRRWGPRVGGLVVGLPITSLPLLALVDLTDGSRFAVAMAGAGLVGVVPQTLALYVWAVELRRRRTGPALLAGLVAFGGLVTGLSVAPPLPAVLAAGGGLVCLILALRRWPAVPAAAAPPDTARTRSALPTGSDLVLRLVLAATFTVLIGHAAGVVGPRLSGLVSAFPVITVVMGFLTSRSEGSGAASTFLRAVARGSFPSVTALLALASVLPTGHVLLAFAAAVVAAIVTQVGASVLAEGASDAPAPALQPARRELARGATGLDPTLPLARVDVTAPLPVLPIRNDTGG